MMFRYVTTTSKSGIITEHHDKEIIKQVLCKENKHKYQLAYNTPITQQPLLIGSKLVLYYIYELTTECQCI